MDLIIEHLSKRFADKVVLRDICFTFTEGRIYGLLGRNGAGKTTFFSVISGFEAPTSGKIYLEGEEITGNKPYVLCKRGLVRTYQIVKPFKGMTTLDNAMVGSFVHTNNAAHAKEKAMQALKLTHLDHKADVQGGR